MISRVFRRARKSLSKIFGPFIKNRLGTDLLYVETTNRCNARCIFCVYPSLKDEINTKIMEMGFFAETLEAHRRMGGTKLGLTPCVADPLTDPLISERIKLAEKLGYSEVILTTNLISLGKEHQQGLLDIRIKVKIRISVVGLSRGDYAKYMGVDKFDVVIRNLKILSRIKKQNENLHVGVIIRDYDGIENHRKEFLDLVQALDFCPGQYSEFDTWGGLVDKGFLISQGLAVKAMRSDKSSPCAALFDKKIVSVNGDVRACECRDPRGELTIGNLNREPLESIICEDRIQPLIERFKSGNLPRVCSMCEFYQKR